MFLLTCYDIGYYVLYITLFFFCLINDDECKLDTTTSDM